MKREQTFRPIFFVSIFTILNLISFPVSASDNLKPVKLMKVSKSELVQERRFFGRVVAKQTVDLAFQVGGQINKFPVTEGQTLKQGDLIASLDPEQFELALSQAKLQREQAARTAGRLQKLSGGVVSRARIEDAQTQSDLSVIAVQNAERSLRHSVLKAPFDALVASRNVSNFTTIPAGTAVVRIHDMSELRIEIEVPEILFQRTGSRGRRDDIELSVKFPAIDERFPVTVKEFNAETSSVGQTFQITLGMPRPKEYQIFPGSSAIIFARIPQKKSGIKIPASAVIVDADGKTSVMAFTASKENKDQGTVQKVPVTVEATSKGAILVTAGLKNGQQIVVAGGSSLNEGLAVRRFTDFGQ